MVPLCREVYVDPSSTSFERARLARDYAEARGELLSAFGSLESQPPLTLFCKSSACIADFAGPTQRSRVLEASERVPGATYVADRTTIVMTREDAGARGVLLHELVHVEMLARLKGAHVPQWFDEGLAFSIANRSYCPDPPRKAIDDLRRLDYGWGPFVDLHFQEKSRAAYCQAFAEVDAWMHRHGRGGLLALIDAVREGRDFYTSYGSMLTQTSDNRASDDTAYDHGMVLSNALFDTITLSGEPESYARMYGFSELADGGKPFSISMWINPSRNSGTLFHLSSNPDGTGWCAPFLGYDEDGRVVGQVLRGNGPGAEQFSVTASASPPPLHNWTHVAMTWAPRSANRLYIDGVKVAEVDAPFYRARGLGSPLYATWGSSNSAGGAACWHGAIRAGGFAGSIEGPKVYSVELTAAAVARLAHSRPQ